MTAKTVISVGPENSEMRSHAFKMVQSMIANNIIATEKILLVAS